MKEDDKTIARLRDELAVLRQRVGESETMGSEREQAEKELRESESRYRSLFENMENGFALHEMIFDDAGRPIDYIFLDVNDAFERQTTLRRADLIGKRVTEVLPGIKSDSADWIGTYGKVTLTGESVSLESYSEPLERWFSAIAYRPTQNQFAVVFTDITVRKQMEIQLQEANRRLEETNQSLQDMVYIASHDLQSPLISMEGFTGVLLEDYRDSLDSQGIRHLERVQESVVRMQTFVDSLLDISRLNTVRNPFETFEPREILGDLVSDLSLMLEYEQAEIEILPMPTMCGDRQRIEGVFRRLITNAIKYGGEHIAVGYENDAYFVRDDGIGLPASQLEKIFIPGERLKRIDAEGSGMGLTFCRNVVTQHDGRIWAESAGEDSGSTFYLTIG
jgi:PAS domain S-box-containing protein